MRINSLVNKGLQIKLRRNIMGNGTFATDYAGSGNIASVTSLTGNADGDKGIMSIWFLATNANTFIYEGSFLIGASGPFGHGLRILGNNLVDLLLTNNINGPQLRIRTQSAVVFGVWNHFLASWDTTAGLQSLAFNDDPTDITVITNNSLLPIDYTRTHSIGGGVATFPTTNEYGGCLSELYLNFSEFLDFGIEADRRLFIDSAGLPVELGSDGSIPTGTAPIMYFPDGDATANAGTGGNLIQPGAVVPCATTPRIDINPIDAVQALILKVMGLNIKQGISNSLDVKLDSVLKALDDMNVNNDVAAINSLEAFINAVQAQSGKSISVDDANELIADAQAIIDVL